MPSKAQATSPCFRVYHPELLLHGSRLWGSGQARVSGCGLGICLEGVEGMSKKYGLFVDRIRDVMESVFEF